MDIVAQRRVGPGESAARRKGREFGKREPLSDSASRGIVEAKIAELGKSWTEKNASGGNGGWHHANTSCFRSARAVLDHPEAREKTLDFLHELLNTRDGLELMLSCDRLRTLLDSGRFSEEHHLPVIRSINRLVTDDLKVLGEVYDELLTAAVFGRILKAPPPYEGPFVPHMLVEMFAMGKCAMEARVRMDSNGDGAVQAKAEGKFENGADAVHAMLMAIERVTPEKHGSKERALLSHMSIEGQMRELAGVRRYVMNGYYPVLGFVRGPIMFSAEMRGI